MLIIRFNHGSPYMFLSFSAKSVCSYPQGFDNKNITVKTKKSRCYAAYMLLCTCRQTSFKDVSSQKVS